MKTIKYELRDYPDMSGWHPQAQKEVLARINWCLTAPTMFPPTDPEGYEYTPPTVYVTIVTNHPEDLEYDDRLFAVPTNGDGMGLQTGPGAACRWITVFISSDEESPAPVYRDRYGDLEVWI